MIVELLTAVRRIDQASGSANPALEGRRLILMCEHGYSSSLAAASLYQLGVDAGDLVGGFEAWLAEGRATAPAPEPLPGLPGMGGPQYGLATEGRGGS